MYSSLELLFQDSKHTINLAVTMKHVTDQISGLCVKTRQPCVNAPDDLNTESQVVFLSIALSGIVSLTLGLALSILCVMYACMYRDVVESPALPIRVKGVTAHAQKMNTSGDGTQKTK
uniref:Uncharacterized protein n=1 Tax=Cacopsylla melanoneura TaxID=428564 RepID=A0A8D8MBF0_9HEMI